MMRKSHYLCVLLLTLLSGCAQPTDNLGKDIPSVQDEDEFNAAEVLSTMILTSPAFHDSDNIPKTYSCDGQDISPQLDWTAPPEGTQSFALIMDDPDAPVGIWVHWVLYNIPPNSQSLPENIPAEPVLKDGSLHGVNSWRRTDYGGPCPPSGKHRYFFKLYALDTILKVDAGLTDQQLLMEMDGHVLAKTQLMGTYSR